ncbi:heme exporter protein CcmD [Alphaproteobacteria bacterium]|nr:heme exporter protein CcmD [Alphaproteobacteria bacterium]
MTLASTSFWSMGGYGQFVWPSYIIIALAMIVLVAVSLIKLKSLQRKFKILRKLLDGEQK